MAFDLATIGPLSPTRAEALLKCPARAALRSTDGVQVPTPAAALGTACHEVAAEVHRGRFDELAESELRDALTSAWDAAVEAQADVMATASANRKPPPQRRWRGHNMARVRLLRSLEDQVRARKSGLAREAVAVEQWLESSDGSFAGQVDLVERSEAGDHIIDLKSGAQGGHGISDSHLRQLLIYAYLWEEETGNWPVDVSIQGLDGKMETEVIERGVVATLLADLTDRRNAATSQIAAGISSDDLATPGPDSCTYCVARSQCGSFFDALDASWGLSRVSLLGEVTEVIEAGPSTSLDLMVRSSNGFDEGSEARVIGFTQPLGAEVGDSVAIIDVSRTSTPGHARANWDSVLSRWHEA